MVSRQWIYKLLARYREEGDQAFQPRSRRPHSQPTAVPIATAELIIRLRGELSGQGLDAGAHTMNRPGFGGDIDPTERWSHVSTDEASARGS
jgi:hypothetical protein